MAISNSIATNAEVIDMLKLSHNINGSISSNRQLAEMIVRSEMVRLPSQQQSYKAFKDKRNQD